MGIKGNKEAYKVVKNQESIRSDYNNTTLFRPLLDHQEGKNLQMAKEEK